MGESFGQCLNGGVLKKIPLTKKRSKFTQQRRQGILVGQPLRHNVRVETFFSHRLTRLAEQMAEDVKKEILKSLKKHRRLQGEDASITSLFRILIRKLSDKYIKIFEQASKPFAESMLKSINKTSRQAMQQSMKALSGGLNIDVDFQKGDLAEVLKASTVESVSLIKSIPHDYFSQVETLVMQSIAAPEAGGWSGLTRKLDGMLTDRHRKIRNKARNLALDQTRKAYNNINAARMKAVGVSKYRWIHSGGGQRPRKHHQEMHGRIYSLDDPPIIEPSTGERGIPGQAINCRCTMLPIIEF